MVFVVYSSPRSGRLAVNFVHHIAFLDVELRWNWSAVQSLISRLLRTAKIGTVAISVAAVAAIFIACHQNLMILFSNKTIFFSKLTSVEVDCLVWNILFNTRWNFLSFTFWTFM